MRTNALWAILCAILAGCASTPTTTPQPVGEKVERLIKIWRPLIVRNIVSAIEKKGNRDDILEQLTVAKEIVEEAVAKGRLNLDSFRDALMANMKSETALLIAASVLTILDGYRQDMPGIVLENEWMLPAFVALRDLLGDIEKQMLTGGPMAMPRIAQAPVLQQRVFTWEPGCLVYHPGRDCAGNPLPTNYVILSGH